MGGGGVSGRVRQAQALGRWRLTELGDEAAEDRDDEAGQREERDDEGDREEFGEERETHLEHGRRLQSERWSARVARAWKGAEAATHELGELSVNRAHVLREALDDAALRARPKSGSVAARRRAQKSRTHSRCRVEPAESGGKDRVEELVWRGRRGQLSVAVARMRGSGRTFLWMTMPERTAPNVQTVKPRHMASVPPRTVRQYTPRSTRASTRAQVSEARRGEAREREATHRRGRRQSWGRRRARTGATSFRAT